MSKFLRSVLCVLALGLVLPCVADAKHVVAGRGHCHVGGGFGHGHHGFRVFNVGVPFGGYSNFGFGSYGYSYQPPVVVQQAPVVVQQAPPVVVQQQPAYQQAPIVVQQPPVFYSQPAFFAAPYSFGNGHCGFRSGFGFGGHCR